MPGSSVEIEHGTQASGTGRDTRRSRAPRVLSLSCVYPNPQDPALGVFVRSRLLHLSRIVELKAVAPIPWIDYAKASGLRPGRRGIAFRSREEALEVFYPAWIYPPGGHTINSLFLFLRLLPLVRGIRKTFDFQLIDAHFGFPDGIAAALLARAVGVPFTVTLRGNETMHARYPQRRKWIAWSLKRASRVVTVSEALGRFALEQGVPQERIRTIPNGIDPAVFYPRDSALCRRELGLPAQGRLILSAGSLIERKGHHRVVRALAALRQKGTDVRLIIAGGPGREGRYEQELRTLIDQLGLVERVILLGEIPPEKLASVMCASDLLCLASTREGWPNVVHEALACGTPVVATNVGAVAEMISSAQIGLVVPVGDGQALEHALLQAFAQDWDREKISAAGRSRTWESVASEIVCELEGILADSVRRSEKQ